MKSGFAAFLPAVLSVHSLLGQTPAGTLPAAPRQPVTTVRSLSADSIYAEVEHMPELPGGGGKEALVAAIQRTVRFPILAVRCQVEGWVVVRFVVETSGEVSNVTVVRWSRDDGQKKDVYFFCYDSKKERGVARQTA